MKRCLAALFLTLAGVSTAVAQTSGLDDTANLETAGNVTVVTSDRLTYDSKAKYALFENNVVVTDPQLQLTSDKLTLYFDDAGDAKTILAEGRVHINQADKKSVSSKATYDVPTGKIFLEGKPRVTRGQDVLEGDTITFWRNEERMECYPRARLVIFPDESGERNKMIGKPGPAVPPVKSTK